MLEFQIFLTAFISSFLWLIVPWVTSALSVSILILLGIPVQIAKTTYQIGNVWVNLWALFPLLKSQKLRKDIIIPLFLVALLWWYIWWNILITLPTHILLKMTGVFMIGMLMVNIFSKSLWVIGKEVTKWRKYTGFIAYFILNIFFAIFPMGTWVLFQALHTFFFRVTHLEARLIGCILTTPFAVGFIFPVIASWLYNITYMILFTVWGYFGWYLGAHSGIRLWNFWLKKILMGWLFSIGIYFLFFI